MPKVIEAIYENGVFKPLEKVELKNGERVRVEIRVRVVDEDAGIPKASDEKVKRAFELIDNGEGIY